ncbi:small acid-soluble spore protein P [Paenibacillus spongiae]|uniref:Small acid-soluble spore protein P n=1 Tax=Paenibacillus spongiae TaxID=2909671 RepID=A0ABY5SCB3_9BACL|nr:small acid-soluble spore protein P [Paenibacillus spongiae]UVI30402.1 small acid-soluble spore protein P [Paenibacillus spongiae]
MSKPRAVPVPDGENHEAGKKTHAGPQEPLSGSKKVKNQNHTRHNNGEG